MIVCISDHKHHKRVVLIARYFAVISTTVYIIYIYIADITVQYISMVQMLHSIYKLYI